MEEATELANYLSQKDVEICIGFDAESLADRPEIEGIRELHAMLERAGT